MGGKAGVADRVRGHQDTAPTAVYAQASYAHSIPTSLRLYRRSPCQSTCVIESGNTRFSPSAPVIMLKNAKENEPVVMRMSKRISLLRA
jgi:hypothetical protein